jgi:hypothetical protein
MINGGGDHHVGNDLGLLNGIKVLAGRIKLSLEEESDDDTICVSLS